jgi:hypothetical protein
MQDGITDKAVNRRRGGAGAAGEGVGACSNPPPRRRRVSAGGSGAFLGPRARETAPWLPSPVDTTPAVRRGGVALDRSGWLEIDLAPLLVDGNANDVADTGRRLLGRAEIEMVQDPADGQGVGDVGHHRERASAASADESVGSLIRGRVRHAGLRARSPDRGGGARHVLPWCGLGRSGVTGLTSRLSATHALLRAERSATHALLRAERSAAWGQRPATRTVSLDGQASARGLLVADADEDG